MGTIKQRLQKWLEITEPKTLNAREDVQRRRIDELQKELADCMKYIGALYEHLELRPRRTFVQDYSRLPAEEYPTTEVIKAEVVKRSSAKRPKPTKESN